MFPTQSVVKRLGRFWLLPIVAVAMLLLGYAVFASSTAQAATPTGDYCIEGVVINWEEEPLAGWAITLTSDVAIPGANGGVTTTVSAESDDDDFDKGEFEFADLLGEAGTYTATIETRPGWEGVTPTSLTFPIESGEDGCVRIRFKMRRLVNVTAVKIDVNHNGLEDWKIEAIPGPGNFFAEPQKETTNVSGTATFTLTPGLWIFTERPPKQDKDEPKESYKPVVPPNARQELDIDEDDDDLQLIFKNELVTGCIVVQKQSAAAAGNGEVNSAVSEYPIAGWGFKLLRKDGTVARQAVTDGSGQVQFDNLPLGPYVLVEEDRPGWNEITAREMDINIVGNECGPDAEPIIFINEQDDSGFYIEGKKVDANGGYGIPGWEISAEPLEEGGFEPDDVVTDGLGRFRFDFPKNDYRVPGAKYEVCEEEKDGWVPHTPTCQTVRLPEWPGSGVELKDFVNQQVGHSESEKQSEKWDKAPMMGKDPRKGQRPSMGNDIKCSTTHVVKDGEGLYDIGRKYDKTPQQMLDANPSVRENSHQWIYVGQQICIP